ncbi:MAG: glutamyl-tRNA reductase [Coriobacteriia bacterium]
MHLSLIGLSHKTAPVEIRERLTFPQDRQGEALSALLATDHVAEAVILSTCNRTEVYAVVTSGEAGRETIIDFLAENHGIDRHELVRYLYMLDGGAVVKHLFRVVSSLDSMVVGEAQILGQVKDAYEKAMEHGATGRVFNKLFRQSFVVGKRVRTETEIGENAVSISYAAVELAKKVFEDLAGTTILIVGAGKMSELTAKHLVSCGVETVLVANRTLERAQDLAAKFDGQAVPYEDLFDAIARSDIVISSTAATEYVIRPGDIEPCLRGRGNRPLFLIDIAVPRDIDPGVNELKGCFLYDIDDLQGVVDSNLEERMREARRAEAIIEDEIAEFAAWLDCMEVVPTVAAIRAQAEKIRQAELERALKRLGGLSEKELKTVEALTASIVNKMLHEPTKRLKECAAEKDGYVRVEAIRHLYGLDDAGERPGYAQRLKGLLGVGDRSSEEETGDTVGA